MLAEAICRLFAGRLPGGRWLCPPNPRSTHVDHRLIPSIPLFDGVKRRRRLALAALVDEVAVPAGTVVTREGAWADEFFVIVDGDAEVGTRSSARIATLGRGDVFGEIGLIAGPRRSATVVAVTPMRLLVAHRRDFSTLRHAFPVVGRRIDETFAARTAAVA